MEADFEFEFGGSSWRRESVRPEETTGSLTARRGGGEMVKWVVSEADTTRWCRGPAAAAGLSIVSGNGQKRTGWTEAGVGMMGETVGAAMVKRVGEMRYRGADGRHVNRAKTPSKPIHHPRDRL